MELSKYKEIIAMENNFNHLRVGDQMDEDDVGLSRFRVNVRRQNTSIEEVFLGMFGNAKRYKYNFAIILEKEFLSFLRKNFPHYNEKMVIVPGEGFHYKLPGNQHGIPSKAKEIRFLKIADEKKYSVGSKRKASPTKVDYMKGGKHKKKAEKTESDFVHTWEKAASGQFAEQRVYDMLVKKFSDEPCLLVHEFKENDLVKVIKENIDNEKKENLKDNELNQREFQYFKLINRHFNELEKQITKMMETLIEDRFFEESIPCILDEIKENKPAYDLLTDSNKKTYLKKIEDFLKKKLKDGAQCTKFELKDLLLEHFLNLTYPNSEYDLLLFLKVCEMPNNKTKYFRLRRYDEV